MKKLYLAAILTLAVLISLLPAGSVRADEIPGAHTDHEGWTEITSANAASMTTLSSGRYYLGEDLIVNHNFSIAGDVTFCLNGHTISFTNASGFAFDVVSGTSVFCDCRGGGCAKPEGSVKKALLRTQGTSFLTITGGSWIASAGIASSTSYKIGFYADDSSTLNILDGYFEGTHSAVEYWGTSHGTINGGHFTINPAKNGESVSTTSAILVVREKADVTVNGGEFSLIGYAGSNVNQLHGLHCQDNSRLTINNCTVVVSSKYILPLGLYTNSSLDTVMNGGSISLSSEDNCGTIYGIGVETSGTLYINGGSVTATDYGSATAYAVSNKGKLIVSGGSFHTVGNAASKRNENINNLGSLTVSGGSFLVEGGVSTYSENIFNANTAVISGGTFENRLSGTLMPEARFASCITSTKNTSISGGTFTASGTNAYGVLHRVGTLEISGGTINAKGSGVRLESGTFLLSGEPTLKGTDYGDISLKKSSAINTFITIAGEITGGPYSVTTDIYPEEIGDSMVFTQNADGKYRDRFTSFHGLRTRVNGENELEKFLEATGDLTVSNALDGNNTDPAKEFVFTVTLNDSSLSEVFDGLLFTEGVSAPITLKGGESRTIHGLPAGVGYTVSQTDYTADGYTTAPEGANGVIEAEKTSAAAFTNTRNSYGNLTVINHLENSMDPEDRTSFTVTLSDPEINGVYGGMTFLNGVAEFALGDGESLTAENLPWNLSYRVEQKTEEGNTYTAEGDIGSLIADNTVVAAFTTVLPLPPTGDNRLLICLFVMAAALAGMAAVLPARKKCRE